MLISKKLNAAMNRQIGNEFGASLQYVSIAAHFANEGLSVLAAKFYKQADEERDHAMKFVKYVVETGGQLQIPAIPAPKPSFKSAKDAVALALAWEKTVTRQINDLMDIAVKESDYLAQNLLSWFVKEQLEEVTSMDNLLRVVERAGENNLLHVESYAARMGDAEEDED
jgi:ferritin